MLLLELLSTTTCGDGLGSSTNSGVTLSEGTYNYWWVTIVTKVLFIVTQFEVEREELVFHL
jgi:hypothetical protein